MGGQPFENIELSKAFRFDPGWVTDPVPEWWIREIPDAIQAEIITIRIDTLARMLQVQAEGLGKAAELIRSNVRKG